MKTINISFDRYKKSCEWLIKESTKRIDNILETIDVNFYFEAWTEDSSVNGNFLTFKSVNEIVKCMDELPVAPKEKLTYEQYKKRKDFINQFDIQHFLIPKIDSSYWSKKDGENSEEWSKRQNNVLAKKVSQYGLGLLSIVQKCYVLAYSTLIIKRGYKEPVTGNDIDYFEFYDSLNRVRNQIITGEKETIKRNIKAIKETLSVMLEANKKKSLKHKENSGKGGLHKRYNGNKLQIQMAKKFMEQSNWIKPHGISKLFEKFLMKENQINLLGKEDSTYRNWINRAIEIHSKEKVK